MKKASYILYIVGSIHASFTLVVFVFMTVASFIISGPGYTSEIIRQLKEGLITTTFVGTVEEQAAQIQGMFLPMAIGFLIGSILLLASLVIGFIASKKEDKMLYILTIVSGGLTLNIPFILAGAFGLAANRQEGEMINAIY